MTKSTKTDPRHIRNVRRFKTDYGKVKTLNCNYPQERMRGALDAHPLGR